MRYLSVCSGIEAATVAWHGLGWQPVAYSEIEKFPSQVLSHHYPNTPNMGDMTNYKEWNLGTINLLVGGTPCQSFSVAGLRRGLEDPRGNLALVYCGILDKFRPKWFVWENVPGVLSSNGGRDFGSFLGAVAQLGYGFAYRVLDAQYFGVPQRRKRVFVVGCFGDWVSASKVLFESESLSRNPPPSREARKVTPTLSASGTGVSRVGFNCEDEWFVPVSKVYENHPTDSRIKEVGISPTVTSRWGTGGNNVPLVQSVGCDTYNGIITGQTACTMTADMAGPTHSGPKVLVQAYSIREDAKANTFSATPLEVTPALQALRPSVQSHHAQTFIAQSLAVRRLSPLECERLQGFPDGYTDIKEKTADAPRYKALGNSMAVPVMKWIGERINGLC